jgi:hypothetical protein
MAIGKVTENGVADGVCESHEGEREGAFEGRDAESAGGEDGDVKGRDEAEVQEIGKVHQQTEPSRVRVVKGAGKYALSATLDDRDG